MMKLVFFYGLFMDQELLREKGFHPQNVRRVYLQGYQLKIGEKSTLAPSERARVYGTVMEMDYDELQRLYGGAGVEEYEPQTVQVNMMTGEPLDVTVYLLPVEKLSGSNREYAAKLAHLLKTLEFPNEYIDEVESWV